MDLKPNRGIAPNRKAETMTLFDWLLASLNDDETHDLADLMAASGESA